MHVLLQAATATETGALKAEFQMITGDRKKRLAEFRGVVCDACVCGCVRVYFHVFMFV